MDIWKPIDLGNATANGRDDTFIVVVPAIMEEEFHCAFNNLRPSFQNSQAFMNLSWRYDQFHMVLRTPFLHGICPNLGVYQFKRSPRDQNGRPMRVPKRFGSWLIIHRSTGVQQPIEPLYHSCWGSLQPHSISLNSVIEIGGFIESNFRHLHRLLCENTNLVGIFSTCFKKEGIGLMLMEDLHECCIWRMARVAM